jgi:hypothetical protein
MPQRFPFGSIHLDTIWPIVGLMAFTSACSLTALLGPIGHSGGSAAGLMASQMAVLTSSQLAFAFLAGSFVFIFAIRVPETQLHAFYAGFQTRSCNNVAYLLPINLLEDFSKPLSLESEHFRLLGNIMADELTLAVLSSLVAFIVALVDIFGDDACLQFGVGGVLGANTFRAFNPTQAEETHSRGRLLALYLAGACLWGRSAHLWWARVDILGAFRLELTGGMLRTPVIAGFIGFSGFLGSMLEIGIIFIPIGHFVEGAPASLILEFRPVCLGFAPLQTFRDLGRRSGI